MLDSKFLSCLCVVLPVYWHWTPVLNQHLILDLCFLPGLTWPATPHHGDMWQCLEIFWFVTVSRRGHWQLGGHSYRCCPTSYNAPDGQLKQGIILLPMSRVPRMRSLALVPKDSSSNSEPTRAIGDNSQFLSQCM